MDLELTHVVRNAFLVVSHGKLSGAEVKRCILRRHLIGKPVVGSIPTLSAKSFVASDSKTKKLL